MGLISGNQFDQLGDNGNPNRLKPKARSSAAKEGYVVLLVPSVVCVS